MQHFSLYFRIKLPKTCAIRHQAHILDSRNDKIFSASYNYRCSIDFLPLTVASLAMIIVRTPPTTPTTPTLPAHGTSPYRRSSPAWRPHSSTGVPGSKIRCSFSRTGSFLVLITCRWVAFSPPPAWHCSHLPLCH